ncbi:fibronectin type III domain-containing protein 7-like [Corythoichthys intestinalis]|uniref:fibronectin type III domain-containing protein 7-like n=1 Tax=Corythoichthys intestinalis TaxID=161448 RepID=UPI0025A52B60|nr:fibronectin type III domain-containing protein 7-like [Corythoichthys intestinalis]
MFSTGPCQPEGLWVTFHCNNQSAVLSWTPSHNAVDYYGCAQADSGEMLYCHSTDPTCTIPNLDCGTLYSFTVQASDGTCNSSLSDPVERGAAPCPPDAIDVWPMVMYMEVQTLQFTWTEISCADAEYLLRLSGNLLGDSQAQFEVSSYWTERTEFEIPLPCGSSYSATVESRNVAGVSNRSVPLTDTTAPCKPSMVTYSSNSSIARISWNSSVFATMYNVYKHNVSPSSRLCTTSGLSCYLQLDVMSVDLLVTASNAVGESEGSNVINVVIHHVRKRDVSETGDLSAPEVNVTLVTPTTIMANWTRVGNYTSFKLLLTQPQSSSASPLELTVLDYSIILPGLDPNCFYCITVSGKNGDDVGLESDPVCLETEESN